MKNSLRLVADFETTTFNSKQYQEEGHTNVWM